MAINLLPWRENQKTKFLRNVIQSAMLNVIMISLLCVGIYCYFFSTEKDCLRANILLQEKINFFSLKNKSDFNQSLQRVHTLLTLAAEHQQRQFTLLKIVEVIKNFSDDLYIEKIEIENNDFNIYGLSKNTAVIHQVVKKIETTRFIQHLKLNNVDTPRDKNFVGMLKFSISGDIDATSLH